MREELEEDEFYYDELIDMSAMYKDEELGRVSNIIEVPQGIILVIKVEGKKDLLVPFEKKFVPEILDDSLTLDNLEGLLE